MIPLLVQLSLLIGLREFTSLNNGNSASVATAVGLSFLPHGFAAGPRYVPKWKKQACEVPASQHPNSHYVCDEAGEVKCLPGWAGDLCDVPICRKGCDPLQGYCRQPGECRCKLGFYGEHCDKCVALPGCQHGRCNVSFECACDSGWRGLFCSKPICAADCNPSQGYCDKPGECKCRLGWQGPKCKQCSVLPGCVHGTCQGPLECRCEPGWTGLLCTTPLCAPGCSREHGTCRRPGTCHCRIGYTGSNCTECVAYPGCAHGTCRRPWECRCKPGFTGDLCDEKLTFCDENPDICKNNATCISMTKERGNYRCTCPLGFAGRQCQVQVEIPSIDLIPPKPEEPSKDPPPTSDNIEEMEPTSHKPDNEANRNDSAIFSEDKEQTAEPLGPIVITDPAPTVNPATAGKWPTEPPTESPYNDTDNET